MRALAPSVKATTLDLAFAAGFYEGEGTAYRDPRHDSVRAQATQKEREMLDWLRDRFGGNVYKRSDKTAFFQWHISGRRASGFLQSIYPLLSDRRQLKIREVLHLGEFQGESPLS